MDDVIPVKKLFLVPIWHRDRIHRAWSVLDMDWFQKDFYSGHKQCYGV